MNEQFKKFIQECWSEHAKSAEKVGQKLQENTYLLKEKEQAPHYVALIVHVFGGHLSQWQAGFELLESIAKLDDIGQHQSITRGLAVLSYAQGDMDRYSNYLGKSTEPYSELLIHSSIASELTAAGEISSAAKSFKRALELAPDESSNAENIARTLAISGNNLACELETKEERNQEEKDLMLVAAKTARRYWEIAGTWVEVERAEYRLAMSCLKAGLFSQALEHARECQRICQENKADQFEMFFVHEALTVVNRAICQSIKENLSDDLKDYCQVP
jgi:tetratricopeptide (TPR) repeat protein